MPNPKRETQATPQTAALRGSLGRSVLLSFLPLAAVFYAIVLGYHLAYPRMPEIAQIYWLDCCRDLFEQYGLVPTGHIANDARAYVEAVKSQQSANAPTGAAWRPMTTQSHPLLGKAALDFRLNDVNAQPCQLRQFLRQGPVVLVFYYGYHCSHCVAQLFELNRELARFHAVGATVVALSADASAVTASKMAEYGAFDFPVLSDPDHKVAELFGVFRPADDRNPELLEHGTFLIVPDGTIIWTNHGNQPFINNETLLYWLSHLNELIPASDDRQ